MISAHKKLHATLSTTKQSLKIVAIPKQSRCSRRLGGGYNFFPCGRPSRDHHSQAKSTQVTLKC